jgi:hypothetical protein
MSPAGTSLFFTMLLDMEKLLTNYVVKLVAGLWGKKYKFNAICALTLES